MFLFFNIVVLRRVGITDLTFEIANITTSGVTDFLQVGIPQSLVDDNVFHHLGFVRRGLTLEIYLDGQLANSITDTALVDINGVGDFCIGSCGDFSHPSIDGLIDEVEIFDRALSATEIQAIFNAGSAGKCKTQPNQPPVADAGNDQALECTSPGSTLVTLNGMASSDPDGDALTFTWTGPFPEGGGTVTGDMPDVTLPLGTSIITLVVNDGQVDSDPDTVSVTITVRAEGLQSPLVALVPEGTNPVPQPSKAFKQGRTLPLKLQLFCMGLALTDSDVSPPKIAKIQRIGDPPVDLLIIDPDAGEANDNGLEFRYSAPNWVYNLSTKDLSPGKYEMTIEMPDGQRYVTGFVLR